jgi:glycosyltransferase involved in cell wall biosynthesis
MFSIIIPTLNEEKIISQTIKQFDIVRSKYDIEIIVSDSKSSDNTVEVSKQYADKVIIYKTEDNCNIAKARNNGAKNAIYKNLIFLDADIIINDIENFFKKINNQLSDPTLVSFSPRIIVNPSEQKNIDNIVHAIISLISNIMNTFGFGYSRGGCQIIKSKYFSMIGGYNESYVAGEDVDLFRRLRKFGKTSIFNSIVVYESPRRYRKFGYINVLFSWFMNWLYTLIFKKSFSEKW